jgi:large subunit ribosomal protein L54
VNYCCGANYFKEGEDIKLKEDSEYPEWIWSLRLNYPPPIHELDPNTKEYYERLAIVGQQREWRLKSVWRVLKTFIHLIIRLS